MFYSTLYSLFQSRFQKVWVEWVFLHLGSYDTWILISLLPQEFPNLHFHIDTFLKHLLGTNLTIWTASSFPNSTFIIFPFPLSKIKAYLLLSQILQGCISPECKNHQTTKQKNNISKIHSSWGSVPWEKAKTSLKKNKKQKEAVPYFIQGTSSWQFPYFIYRVNN